LHFTPNKIIHFNSWHAIRLHPHIKFQFASIHWITKMLGSTTLTLIISLTLHIVSQILCCCDEFLSFSLHLLCNSLFHSKLASPALWGGHSLFSGSTTPLLSHSRITKVAGHAQQRRRSYRNSSKGKLISQTVSKVDLSYFFFLS